MADKWLTCPNCGYNIATIPELLHERHWQVFLAVLPIAIQFAADPITNSLNWADRAVRQYRVPESTSRESEAILTDLRFVRDLAHDHVHDETANRAITEALQRVICALEEEA